jgi:hypothetical protein
MSGAGVVDVQNGTPVDSFADLTDDDIPTVESGYAPLAIARLYEGQTALSRLTANPDIKPVIWGAGLWPLYVSEVDGAPNIAARRIVFQNGTVTDSGDGVATVDPSGASATAIYTSAYGSPPATPGEGDLWMPSDSFYELRYNGSAWVPWGPLFPLTLPPTTGWSWDNQGSATVDTSKGGLRLDSPADAAAALHVYHRAAPSVPYVITAIMLIDIYAVNYNSAGLCFRQSSDGKIHAFHLGLETALLLRSNKWTNSSTFSAHYDGGGFSMLHHRLWPAFLRIGDDNTNRICSISVDGQNWYTYKTIGRTDFLTADQVGIFVKPQNGTYGCGMNLLSWAVT